MDWFSPKASCVQRFLHCAVLRIGFKTLFYVFTLSSDGLSAAIAVSMAMHVYHCQSSIDCSRLRIFYESVIPNIAYRAGNGIASASAVCYRREEATDDRLCNGSYKPVCLGASSGLHMTESSFCVLSKRSCLISPKQSSALH